MIPKHHPQRGLTLVEAAVVLAVVAITAAIAAPGLQRQIELRRLDGAASQLAATLQLARNESIARNRVVRLALDESQRCVVLHTGPAGSCRCTPRGESECNGAARPLRTLGETSGITLQANAGSLAFDPLHGTVTPTGSFRLTGRNGREIQHVVNVMGRVRSCSPGAAVPGYPAC